MQRIFIARNAIITPLASRSNKVDIALDLNISYYTYLNVVQTYIYSISSIVL